MVSEELYHHGIKGQKWGIRRGPPYPLGKSDKKTTYSGRKLEEAKHLTNRILARTIPGYAQAVDAYNIVKAGIKRKVADSRLKKDTKLREKNTLIDEKTGLRLKDREYSDEEDLQRVNPGYSGDAWFFKDKGTSNNCVYCTTAYELRKRGYDVRAKRTETGHGLINSEIDALWTYKDEKKTFNIGPNYDDKTGFTTALTKAGQSLLGSYRRKEKENLIAWAKDQPDQRGNLTVVWGKSGHSMIYEIKNGNLILKDAQVNKSYKNSKAELDDMFNVGTSSYDFMRGTIQSVTLRRTDNAIPNWDKLKELVE